MILNRESVRYEITPSPVLTLTMDRVSLAPPTPEALEVRAAHVRELLDAQSLVRGR